MSTKRCSGELEPEEACFFSLVCIVGVNQRKGLWGWISECITKRDRVGVMLSSIDPKQYNNNRGTLTRSLVATITS